MVNPATAGAPIALAPALRFRPAARTQHVRRRARMRRDLPKTPGSDTILKLVRRSVGDRDSGTREEVTPRLVAGPVPNSTLPETALAIAFVTDPQHYSVTFDSAFRPQIDFTLSINAGASLTATGSNPGETSSSMFAGTFGTSLLAGDLWSFSWTADSAHPSESVFHFSSNPVLGLNDASIEGSFNSVLSDSGGTHTLMNSFSVTGSLFPTLQPGSSTLNYSTGGETTLEANAAIAPEPEAFWLLGAGLAGLAAMRRRRARA
jgi:hypothetical protein